MEARPASLPTHVRAFHLLAILAALVALLAVGPRPAFAANTVVNFDDRAAVSDPITTDKLLTDQYVDSAGIEFGHPHRWGFDANISEGCGGGGAGAQWVAAGGISGNSLRANCTGRPPTGEDSTVDRGFALGWRFLTTRQTVSFRMRVVAHAGYIEPGPHPVTVRVIGLDGSVLEAHTYSLADGQVFTPALGSYNKPYPVAYVLITGPEGQIDVDDITAPLDASPPSPAFSLVAETPNLTLTEGDTDSVPVRVVRFNGSTGPVTVTPSALPTGVVSASAPVLGGTASVPFSITAASPATGTATVTLGATSAPASAGTFVGGSKSVAVTFQTAVTGDRTTVGATPGCGSNFNSLYLGVRGNYDGTVHVTYTKLSGPATLTPHATQNPVHGNGTVGFGFDVSSPATSSPSTYDVLVEPDHASPIHVPLAVYAGAADSVTIDGLENSSIGHSPGSRSTHYQAIIRGNFPTSCPVDFFDDSGTKLAIVPGHVSQEAGQSPGLRLDLGTDPTTTAIRAINSSGAVLATSPVITVNDYRNTNGSRQVNGGAGAAETQFNWNDFQNAFGKDETEDCFLGITCWRDPTAKAIYEKQAANIGAGGGICFGWASQSVAFATGVQRPGDYEPGAVFGYSLTNFADSTAIKHSVGTWQVRYQNRDTRIAVQHQVNSPYTAAGMKQAILDSLARNQEPLIVIWNATYGSKGVAGHAVAAYDIRDDSPTSVADGGFDIVTYNPNIPFDPTELTNAGTHSGNMSSTLIHVTGAGQWSGGIPGWSGPMSTIEAVPLPPLDSTLPTDLPTLAASSAAPGVAQVAQITVDRKAALRPDGSVVPGSTAVADASDPTGGSPAPAYQLLTGAKADVQVIGQKPGTYDQSLVGGSVVATVSGATTSPGQRDAFSVQPNESSVTFQSAAKSTTATLELDAKLGQTASGARATAGAAPTARPTRSVDAVITAGGGRTDTVSLQAGDKTVVVEHEGPASTLTLSLTDTSAGLPTSASLAPIAVPAGGQVAVKPATWGDLTGNATYTVKNAKGKIVRRGTARRTAPKTVGIAKKLKFAAKRTGAGGTVTVSGRITKAGGSPLLAVVVKVMRGKHVLSTTPLSRSGVGQVPVGPFTLPVPIGALPKGATLQVSASVIDENDLATAKTTAKGRVK